MATITLKDGDFGKGATVLVGSESLYLPDPAHPGLTEAVALTDIAGIEAVDSDRSSQVKEAVRLSAKGFLSAGPAGLAMGVLAATKVKNVVFSVRLNDGRHFTATADAKTYAELRGAQVAARSSGLTDDTVSHAADEIIAKYVGQAKPVPADNAPAPVNEPSPPAGETPPPPAQQATPIAAAPSPDERASRATPSRVRPERPQRPVFGRRTSR